MGVLLQCWFASEANEHSSWRLLMPLGMFSFAQSIRVLEEVISLLRIMLCYEINVNEQIEFHTLINSVTEEELNGNRSLWWLMNDLQG